MSKAVSFFIGFLIAAAFAWVYVDNKDSDSDKYYQNKIDSLNVKQENLIKEINRKEKDIKYKDTLISGLYDKLSEEKEKREEAEKRAKQNRIEIDSLPLDSVAEIVTDYFGGGDHKVIEVDKNVYVAFRDITVRNIAKGTIEIEKLKYEKLSLLRGHLKKDSIISNLEEIRMDQDSIIDFVNTELAIEKSKGDVKDEQISSLKRKVKQYKIIGSAGVVIGILIAIL